MEAIVMSYVYSNKEEIATSMFTLFRSTQS